MNRLLAGGILILLPLLVPASAPAADGILPGRPVLFAQAAGDRHPTPPAPAAPAAQASNASEEAVPEGSETGEFPADLVADGPVGSEITEASGNDLESQFHEQLLAGNAMAAEATLKSALATAANPLPVHIARMMWSMGSHYVEEDAVASAQYWLGRTLREGGSYAADEESGKTLASLAKPKLEWLQSGGRRPWTSPDPQQLAEKLSAAVIKNDGAALKALLTQVDPYVGEWQSEWESCQGTDLLEFLDKHWKPGITWDSRDVFRTALAAKEPVLYLNTHGWKSLESHANIQFALHKVAQGWEWRGIVLGE